jgi:hypothetical protein
MALPANRLVEFIGGVEGCGEALLLAEVASALPEARMSDAR